MSGDFWRWMKSSMSGMRCEYKKAFRDISSTIATPDVQEYPFIRFNPDTFSDRKRVKRETNLETRTQRLAELIRSSVEEVQEQYSI